MRRTTWGRLLLVAAIACAAAGSAAEGQPSGHYLFAWAGDVEKKGSDFLAVIDADPRSASYGRLVATGYDVNRLFMLKLDRASGVVSFDTAFHDTDGKPGFSFDERAWPHGWKGSANPHGVVFSR